MKYNIDTKENFDIITPQIDIFNQYLADEFSIFIKKNIELERSVIIDFNSIKSIEVAQVDKIEQFHHALYNSNLSFVICNVNDLIKKILNDKIDELNITPKLIEAIDIVSMENLERELLGGDDLDF